MSGIFIVALFCSTALYWFNSSNDQRAKNEALEMSKGGIFVVVDKVMNGNYCRIVVADLSDRRFVVSPEDQSFCLALIPKDRVTVTFKDMVSYGLTNKSAGNWLTIKRLP
ncbi:MAG: hypothetical protein HYT94_03515 [Parcubacteria group bacterium]|nr:hypothetical protein [Parcubacteria group bacterium]